MTIQLLRDERNLFATAIQKVGEKLVYATDWTERVSRLWTPATLFGANVAIRPKPVTGFQYLTTAGGLSSQLPPVWPLVIGATVVDGSVTWKTAAIDTTSLLKTPSTQTWNPDAGLVVTAQALTGNVTQAIVDSTGATEGSNYYVRNFVTMSDGTIEEAVFNILVRSGAT